MDEIDDLLRWRLRVYWTWFHFNKGAAYRFAIVDPLIPEVAQLPVNVDTKLRLYLSPS